jgi:hypothetical protein
VLLNDVKTEKALQCGAFSLFLYQSGKLHESSTDALANHCHQYNDLLFFSPGEVGTYLTSTLRT